MDEYMYWLDNILYLGCKAKRRLLEVFHTPKEIYCSEEKQWAHLLDENKAALMKDAKEKWDVDGAYEELLKKKRKSVCFTDRLYFAFCFSIYC